MSMQSYEMGSAPADVENIVTQNDADSGEQEATAWPVVDEAAFMTSALQRLAMLRQREQQQSVAEGRSPRVVSWMT